MKYESTVILKGSLVNDEYSNAIKNIHSFFNENIKDYNLEEMGTQRLPFQIEEENNGHYVVIDFDSSVEQAKAVEKYYSANNNVLKYMTLNMS